MADTITVITNFTGERIGKLVKDYRGNVKALDRYDTLLGNYNSKLNITTEYPSGRIIAKGDITNALIWKAEEIRKAKLSASTTKSNWTTYN